MGVVRDAARVPTEESLAPACIQGDAGASAPDDAHSTSRAITFGNLIRALETLGQLLDSDARLRDDLLEPTYARCEFSASVTSPPSSSAAAAVRSLSPASP